MAHWMLLSCLKRKLFVKRLESLDESFFAYYEDVDFSLRIKKTWL